MVRRASAVAIASCLLALTAACGARRIELPSDPGTALAGFSTIHAEVSAACREVRTLAAVLSLSGRAGDERLRGDVHTAIRRPEDLRLEGVNPFGGTVFVLASDGTGATLLLAREDRVVRDERAEDILGALIGVPLAPADLQAVLTGCVVPDPKAVGGRTHEDGWISIELEGGARLFLQRTDGVWRVRAAERNNWRVDYPEWSDGSSFPERVVLRSETPIQVDVRASLDDVRTNVDLPAAAFTLEIPADAAPLSLEALRESGPLSQRDVDEE